MKQYKQGCRVTHTSKANQELHTKAKQKTIAQNEMADTGSLLLQTRTVQKKELLKITIVITKSNEIKCLLL
jgi:hypothetical protein